MTAAAILNFGQTTFIVTRSISWQYTVHSTTLVALFQRNTSILGEVITIFPNPRWRPPPSCFCKHHDFSHAFYYKVPFCTSVPNLMNICLSTAQKWHIDEIQSGGRRHLEFWLDGIFGHGGPIYSTIFNLRTKFEPNSSILGKFMASFPKSQMEAVHHFGIVMTSFKAINVEYLVMS